MAPHGGGATNWWRRPWGVCTSSTHAELGTRRTALSPWCSHPPLTRRTTTAVVHRRYSRRCTNPLSQVVVRALLQGGWSLVPFLGFLRFPPFFCSMNTNGHREKNTSGGRRSFGWVVNKFAVSGFRPTGNTSHLFGRETTQFDATPTQLDLSDDDNDTPFIIAPVPQRLPPYQRATPAATSTQKLDAKIDEYEISFSDESEAFFTLFRLVE